MEEREKSSQEYNKIERDDIINPIMDNSNRSTDIKGSIPDSIPEIESPELEDKEKKNKCQFPTAYTILVLLELIFFILTYIIPKGKFDTIEYLNDKFIIKSEGKDDIVINATQAALDERNIKIPLDNFVKGLIKEPIAVPDTYKRLNKGNLNFFSVFVYPILGLIDSCGIAFFLFVLGGAINILIEMNALSAGITALSKITKGNVFLLLILVLIIVSLGGSTFGFMEEVLPFYPILVPIFMKNGYDALLSMAPMFIGSMIGCMFSTVNAFSVVIASYSAGINFVDGIYFRLISLALGDTIGILYLYFYNLRIKKDEKKSIVYDIRKVLEEKYLKKEKKDEENKKVETIDDILLERKQQEEENKNKFTLLQKIGLIILMLGFGLMIFGILALNWYFEQMTGIFFGITIIFIFIYRKGEKEGIETFIKGASEFVGVSIIIGLARGINITLKDGCISDTLLNAMSKLIDGMPKVVFVILMFLIFIFLGFFIQSSSGLAVLSMPVFSPLADNAKVSRSVVINTYMFGQYLIGFIAPTGICLIALQVVGIPYNYWIKFIWPFLVILFIFLIILVILNAVLFN